MTTLNTSSTAARRHRHRRVRASIHGTAARPRFSVFRSLKHIHAQLIDDEAKRTLVSASDTEVAKGTKTSKAEAVGKLLAEKAKAAKISVVVFDRGGNKFQGRVKALANSAREGGLTF
jgi:large subunit ribosomal protein L18